MTVPMIEQRLSHAADVVAWPAAANLADEVVAALTAVPLTAPKPQLGRLNRSLAVAAAVVAFIALLMLWAPARRAAADLLGVLGIGIESATVVEGSSFDLDLGETIDPASVIEVFGFEALRPERLAAPDGSYESQSPSGHLIQVWRSSGELPEIGDTGIGMLVTQFMATPASGGFVKSLGEETTVSFVTVGGSEAFWIEGGPHDLSSVDADGRVVEDSTRLAANALIWEAEGITYRLESNLGRVDAIAIAESAFNH